MSSFINKSGKKVAPKGAPRRRAGGPPAAPRPSVQTVIEKSQESPIPSAGAAPDSNPQLLPTPNATQIQNESATPSAPVVTATPFPPRPPNVETSSVPKVQSSSNQQSGPQASHETRAGKQPPATIAPEVQHNVAKTPIVTTAAIARQRSVSPLDVADGSRPAKRRRVEEVVDVSYSLSSPIQNEVVRGPSRSPEIIRQSVSIPASEPVVPPLSTPSNVHSREAQSTSQVVKNAVSAGPSKPTTVDSPTGPPIIHTSSRPRPSNSPNTERLVSYETPPARSSRAGQLSSNIRPSLSGQPAKTVTSSTSSTASKPRAKGARKDQWQVSTPNDVITGKGKRKSRKPADRMQIEPRAETGDGDDLDLPSVSTLAPKARKIRKDKGVKKISKSPLAETSNGSVAGSDNQEPDRADAGTELSITKSRTENQDNQQPPTNAAVKRLANLQKRKAKQLAKNAALSKATGRANAAIIDDAVAQTIEGRVGGSSRAKNGPTFIVTPGTPDREGTSASGRASVAGTEMTEGGTTVRRGRTKRVETPEENESVFIVESQTNMWDLTGRDTENRVGFKSEREKAMQQIDWAEVKIKRKAEEERMARMARGKRNQEDDYDPEEEGMDEDEKLARAVARNKNKRPGLQITLMANGEHVVDEQSQMIDRHRLHEDELELLEEVEEDDLTKKFNVQTYGLWRRKEEDERVMVNEKWSFEQTEKFYDALASFGTDFMIISKLFPGKTRRHIKSKFVREERAEPERIRDALTGHAGGRRNGEGSGWDLETFRKGAGLEASAFLDPKKIEEELKRERIEREKEIEEARAEAAEEDRQRKLAGALNGDDELGSDGEPLSPGGVVRAAQAEARRKKLARLGEKKRKILEMAGGEEEIVESIEDD